MEGNPAVVASDEPRELANAAARQELDRVLRGPSFAASARSQAFLRYIAEETLNGRADQLKERNIATAVFARDASYDPSEDSIVRVKALEVRKRLERHYAQFPAEAVKIILPSGRYIPQFEMIAPTPETAPEPVAPLAAAEPMRWMRPWSAALILGCAALATVLAAWGWTSRREPVDAMSALWGPLASRSMPVLISLPSPVVYTVRPNSGDVITQSEVTRVADYYVGTGAAFGAAQFAARLAERGGRFVIKINPDVSFADLRNQSAIFLGAHTSSWAMQFSRKLRYRFEQAGGMTGVVDSKDPRRRWMRPVPSGGEARVKEDFAVVARIFDPSTGNVVMLSSGCGAQGTYMASDFLSSDELFDQFVRQAPPNWPTRSFEAVLHAEVYGSTPGRPRLLAWEIW